jgi:exodeoxyribonuclease V alpha subunit
VAVNEKSPLCRKAVNHWLQAELNPIGQTVESSDFRTDDKIICLKNGSVPADKNAGDPDVNQGMDEDGKVYVANGEMGMVLKVESKRILAAFTNPDRQIVIPTGRQDDGESSTGNFDLAYGATCHKLQGSEYKVVIVVLDDYPGARMVCSREWLQTALSRAKVVCILIGNRATADAMCKRLSLGKRKTFLKELIEEKDG